MMPAALTAWYEKQSERDQRVLRWGALGIALIILLGVFVPLQRALSQARTRLADVLSLVGGRAPV